MAQFKLPESVGNVIKREDSGNRHFQLAPRDQVGKLGQYRRDCGIRAAFGLEAPGTISNGPVAAVVGVETDAIAIGILYREIMMAIKRGVCDG